MEKSIVFELQHDKRNPGNLLCIGLKQETFEVLTDHVKIIWKDFAASAIKKHKINEDYDMKVLFFAMEHEDARIKNNIETFKFVNALVESLKIKLRIKLCDNHNKKELQYIQSFIAENPDSWIALN